MWIAILGIALVIGIGGTLPENVTSTSESNLNLEKFERTAIYMEQTH